MRLRFALPLAQIGPEARARGALAADLLTPFSVGSGETQQFAYPAGSLPQPYSIPRDRLTQTSPHCLHTRIVTRPSDGIVTRWHGLETPSVESRICRPGTLSPSGVRAGHTGKNETLQRKGAAGL